MKEKDRAEIIQGYKGEVTGSPGRAIRAYCVKWCMESVYEVRECTSTDCALWPFRLGSNPYARRPLQTAEKKAAFVERLAKYRSDQAAARIAVATTDGDIGGPISGKGSQE
jgi:hypothetical protein